MRRSPASRSPSVRAPLTRERILDEALALVDEEGLAKLSMRRLGARLGCEAMSLYHHVANKEALLAGVLDRVLSQVERPDASLPWPAWVRAWAVNARGALIARPDLAALLVSDLPVDVGALALMASFCDRLDREGLSPAFVHHAWHVVFAVVLGTLVQDRLDLKARTNRRLAEGLAADLPQDLHGLGPQLPHMASCVADDAFARVLDTAVRGLVVEAAEPG